MNFSGLVNLRAPEPISSPNNMIATAMQILIDRSLPVFVITRYDILDARKSAPANLSSKYTTKNTDRNDNVFGRFLETPPANDTVDIFAPRTDVLSTCNINTGKGAN
jgi:hypothetical protein